MALEGTFKDFHIADILQLIGLHQKTGVLTLDAGEEAIQLFVRDGEVVGVQADRPPLEPRVAAVLVARGVLAPGTLDEALKQHREKNQPLGAILTVPGGLPKKEWTSAVATELEGRLYHPFRWKDAKYRFLTQGAVEPGEGAVSPLRVDNLLMEGMRRADEWPLVLQDVPSPKMVFKVGGRQAKINPRDVHPADIAMLKLVDGKRTVEELVALSGLGEFEAWSGLANLVRANAVSAVGPVPAAPAEGPTARAVSARPIRRAARPAHAAPPAWIARAAWAAALVCLLVVLAVLGGEPLGMFPASPGQQRSLDLARALRAREEMEELARRVEVVRVLTGSAPASVEALSALAPAGRSLLQDPWGQPYRLTTEGGRTSVVSSGADGRPGTPDDLAL